MFAMVSTSSTAAAMVSTSSTAAAMVSTSSTAAALVSTSSTAAFAEVAALLLFCIGLLGLIVRRNMMMTIISSGIMNIAVVLFFLVLNSHPSLVPPMMAENVVGAADPIPQALMITSVVLGVSVQAVCLVLTMITFSEYGTLDWNVAKRIRDGLQPANPVEPSGSGAGAVLFRKNRKGA